MKAAIYQQRPGHWARLSLALALLGLLSSCELLPTIAVKEKEKKEAAPHLLRAETLLTHGPSGVKFTPKVGALYRRGKSTGVDPKPNIAVFYRYTDLEPRGNSDRKYYLNTIIMVVPLSFATPDKLRSNVRDEIEKAHPDATHESISGPHGQADYLTFSHDRSEFRNRLTNRLSVSQAAFAAIHPSGVELHAFQQGNFTVLYRFEFVTSKHEDFSKIIVGFINKFEAMQAKKVSTASVAAKK